MKATDGPGAVLVTGGASGLGAAVALAVEAAGGRAFVLDLVTPIRPAVSAARARVKPTTPNLLAQ